MSLEVGDMIEVVDTVRGLDDLNRSYELLPGDRGLLVDEQGDLQMLCGILIGSEIIYVSEICIQKVIY